MLRSLEQLRNVFQTGRRVVIKLDRVKMEELLQLLNVKQILELKYAVVFQHNLVRRLCERFYLMWKRKGTVYSSFVPDKATMNPELFKQWSFCSSEVNTIMHKLRSSIVRNIVQNGDDVGNGRFLLDKIKTSVKAGNPFNYTAVVTIHCMHCYRSVQRSLYDGV